MQEISNELAVRNSTKLLHLTTVRDLSDYTTDLISDILGPIRSYPTQHGKMVIKILDILENNDTEEKVIQSLEKEAQLQEK